MGGMRRSTHPFWMIGFDLRLRNTRVRRLRTRVPRIGLASLFESCGGAGLRAGRYRDARRLPGERLVRAGRARELLRGPGAGDVEVEARGDAARLACAGLVGTGDAGCVACGGCGVDVMAACGGDAAFRALIGLVGAD